MSVAAIAFLAHGHAAAVASAPVAQVTSTYAKSAALIPFSLKTQFPSTFGGDRVFYGLALFSLMVVSLTALMALSEIIKLFRSYNERWRTPAQMHRISLGSFMVTVLMLSLPPAVFNLLWGEVAPATLLLIRRIQIGCQAAAYLPFLFGMASLVSSRHAITFQLIRMPLPVDLWSNKEQLMRSARMGGLCCLIAALVAYAK